MSENAREAGYIMRIGVMAFVLPIWALATGFFLLNGEHLYAGLMLFFGVLMSYGVYMNYKRLASDEKIDDERMKQINWKSGANAFWTMINVVVFSWMFQWFFVEILPITEAWLIRHDATLLLGAGFFAYFAFRTYYLHYGLENEFWRWN